MSERHLNELELSMFADGELASEELALHVEHCEECQAHLGRALLEVDQVQMAMAHPGVRVASSMSLPLGWMGLVALLGIAPAILHADRLALDAVQWGRAARHFAPLVTRGILASAGPLWVLGLSAGVLTLIVSVTMGFRLAKA